MSVAALERAARAVPSLAVALALLSGCGGAGPAVRAEPAEEQPREEPRYVIALRFEDAAAAEDGTPRTRVSLVRITPEGERTIEELATEPGACFHQHVPGALVAARCWWAGEGASYVVRRTEDGVVATRAEVHEERAGAPAELARLEVPSDAELRVIAPSSTLPMP